MQHIQPGKYMDTRFVYMGIQYDWRRRVTSRHKWLVDCAIRHPRTKRGLDARGGSRPAPLVGMLFPNGMCYNITSCPIGIEAPLSLYQSMSLSL